MTGRSPAFFCFSLTPVFSKKFRQAVPVALSQQGRSGAAWSCEEKKYRLRGRSSFTPEHDGPGVVVRVVEVAQSLDHVVEVEAPPGKFPGQKEEELFEGDPLEAQFVEVEKILPGAPVGEGRPFHEPRVPGGGEQKPGKARHLLEGIKKGIGVMEPGYPDAVDPSVEGPGMGLRHRDGPEVFQKGGELPRVEAFGQKPVEILRKPVAELQGQGRPPCEIGSPEGRGGDDAFQKRLSGFVENIPKHRMSSSLSPKKFCQHRAVFLLSRLLEATTERISSSETFRRSQASCSSFPRFRIRSITAVLFLSKSTADHSASQKRGRSISGRGWNSRSVAAASFMGIL